MAGKSKALFDAQSFANAVLKKVTDEQSRRLVEYAKEKVQKIGQEILKYSGGNNLDRTGNLLNSLCWGVSYRGQLIEGGFYRDAVLRPSGMDGTTESFLHEWFSGDEKYLTPVNGRELAQKYLETYGNSGYAGWKVFFSIRAPYWGYWEEGFELKKSNGETVHKQWSIMTQTFDEVKRELKPMRTEFRHSVAKYDHAKLEKRWNKYAGL